MIDSYAAAVVWSSFGGQVVVEPVIRAWRGWRVVCVVVKSGLDCWLLSRLMRQVGVWSVLWLSIARSGVRLLLSWSWRPSELRPVLLIGTDWNGEE